MHLLEETEIAEVYQRFAADADMLQGRLGSMTGLAQASWESASRKHSTRPETF